MKRFTLYIIVVLVCFACNQNKKAKQPELLVFSAAGLTNVVTELAERFEAEQNIDIHLNFASSGTLARQIEHGAQPSVYISANEKWIDYLIELGLLVPESKKKLAGNSMVAIVPSDSPIDSIQFTSGFANAFNGRLAMGDPKHVPAGDYAQQAIENGGYASALKDRILPAKDVRSAMMVVELGEVEMGIVYKTDALNSKKVKIVSEIPLELHTAIGFYSSVLKDKNDAQTKLFYTFLSSKEAQSIWLKHGFKID
jgi:molybdate transport system substrate-binding protein